VSDAPTAQYFPDDPDGIQRYGSGVLWQAGVSEEAMREIVTYNLWTALTVVVAREGVGDWVRLPEITVRDLPFPEVEGSLASVSPGGRVMEWRAEYWPNAKRDSWLRRAGLHAAADELGVKQ